MKSRKIEINQKKEGKKKQRKVGRCDEACRHETKADEK